MSLGEARVKQEPETELRSNETTDLLYTYQVPIKLEIEFEKEAEVKAEPSCETTVSVNGETQLYQVKEELRLGPERVQPNTASETSISELTPSTSDRATAASLPFTVKHENETVCVLPAPPLPCSLHARYVCNICQKEFSRTDLLRIHKRVHTGEKPYSCNICGREFAQLAHLKVHSMIHTGEKPYGCEVCSMGFRQLSSLKRHARTHAGVKLHACGVCGKRFTRNGHLVKHMVSRHDKKSK